MPPIFSASEFYALQECDRLVYLNHHGDPSLRQPPSAFQQMVMEQGMTHERAVLSSLAVARPSYRPADLEAGFVETLRLMREGTPIIAGGVLLDGDLAGIPDLMIRDDGESSFGDYHYRPADIKLSTRPTRPYQLQVMAYCQMLEDIQGRLPEGELWLKAKEEEAPGAVTITPVIYQPDLLAEAADLLRLIASGAFVPEPYYHGACKECPWRDVCVPGLFDSRDISLLPGLKKTVLEVLRGRGIRRLADLVEYRIEDLVEIRGVGLKTAERLIRSARALESGKPVIIGRPALPSYDQELFFDVESVPSEGLVYLMGILVRNCGEEVFMYELAESKAGEREMWWRFLGRMEGLAGPIYHYGAYERTVMRAFGEMYGGGERGEALMARFVDLAEVLKESVIPPLTGSSLKNVAPWLGFEWKSETKGGADSIQEYMSWLDDGDRAHLERIIAYNADDCRATRVVRDYLANLPEPAEMD